MPMKNPPHPGDFIRTEIIEAAGLTVTAAAKALRVSRPALSSLLNGNASLSGDMALRIEKAFGVNMDTLMRMGKLANVRNKSACHVFRCWLLPLDLKRPPWSKSAMEFPVSANSVPSSVSPAAPRLIP
jgi:antitoxin HigA-1